MVRTSRRAFLGTMATASIAALAGCTGGSGSEAPASLDWFGEDHVQTDQQSVVFDLDTETFLDEWPQAMIDDLEIELLAEQLGADVENIESYASAQSSSATHTVLAGSLDSEAIVESYGGDGDFDSYEDYTVIDEVTYVSDESVLLSTDAETLIDAKAGDVTRAVDTLDELNRAASDVGGSVFNLYLTEPDDDELIVGMGMDAADEETVNLDVRAYFEDEETAQSTYDDEEDEFLDQLEAGELDSIEVQGDMIVVEASAPIDEIL